MVRQSVVVALITLSGTAIPTLAAPQFGPQAPGDRAPGRTETHARAIRLRTGVIDTAAGRSLAESLRADRGAPVRVLQLDGPMTPARRAALEGAGVRVTGYLGDDAFLADTRAASIERAANLGFVRWAGAIRPEWKVAPEFGARSFSTPERTDLQAAGRALAHISLAEGADADVASARIRQIPGVRIVASAVEGGRTVIAATLPMGAQSDIAAIDEVVLVEEAPEATLRNSTTRWIVQTNESGNTPVYANGVTGAGQVVGVIDSKIDVNHCSFFDPNAPIGPSHRKLLAYNTTTGLGSHGTHVAGIVAGDNGDNSDTRGVAYGAKIVFDDIPSSTDSLTGTLLGPLFEQHRLQGARVHTNSWGDDGTTAYTGWCRAIDSFMWDHEDNLVIFAETNLSTLRTPENAKNLIAVAATRDTPTQGNHCYGGIGPTIDGRRKPDIMAPGCSSMAAAAGQGCLVTAKTGTSMASPAVAGAALLAREYYAEGYYPTGARTSADAINPSAALVKATILNSGQDMSGITIGGAAYPNNSEGWGRVTLDGALFFPGDSRELRVVDAWNTSGEALSTGQDAEHTIAVESGAEQLRITMAFTDAPAEILAAAAAVNDLDLEVVSPGGVSYRGNVFDTTTGSSIVGGSWDAINNVEQVHIDSPEPGQWTVRIVGRSVNVGAQGYALVMTGDFAEASSTCLGDITGDGFVDGADFGELLAAWGAGRTPPYDLNDDGVVDGNDLGVILGSWGACP